MAWLERAAKLFLSFMFGSLVGVAVGEVIANSLIEISLTPVFSIIFGIALLLMGAVLFWRVYIADPATTKRVAVSVFAFLVVLSGIFCFLLEERWVHSLSSGAKIPMYSIVGLSLSFSLVFSLVEMLNMGLCTCCCKNYDPKPMVGSTAQIVIVISTALVMGLTFGITFGTLDVEDNMESKYRELEIISIPIGIVCGGLGGLANEWIRGRHLMHVSEGGGSGRRWDALL